MSRYGHNYFVAFYELDGFGVIEGRKEQALQAIKGQADDYILNVNKTEYLDHLGSEFSMQPLEIHQEQLSVSVEERMIPAKRHPSSYWVDNGKSYPKDVYTFHLPFSGDAQLLKVRASTYSMSSPRIQTDGREIQFEIINFNQEAEAIKREADNVVAQLTSQNQNLTNDLVRFNGSLESLLSKAFDARKEQLLKKHDVISALGIPVRKAHSTPSTFSVPAKRTPAIPSKPKPEVTAKGYKPEPTLDNAIYYQILKIIHDVGKQFERLPSTYAGKGEEHLRDHMLLILEPNFEGSATGETFNKKGKTDILLRHEGSNVFVAELKYWHGKKGYLETITQLLSYLTWRDSKAAVVMFISNKEFSPVLETIREVTSEHPNHLGFVKEVEEGWYQYRFHINDDSNREVHIAIQAFHLPR
ncbi:hypothetical protein RB215_08305 [Pseudoalteromonas sp. HL-AS2]|mgnify:CR=1 FL=1|uniref:hypothetical protein n=1 Tax=unclassified Pseudoalteromonas TaxID=194690 RepID=UPI0015FB9165|nr:MULTISPECIES: hypothetical protein [unclassified Pseudoalteromonas]MBB1404699.1 hypothetical protein [Pseudoalteromonas sp. SG44-5]WMS93306.1 hypothetical protein RB215_08305 [Pseudoalteromonas sp. HL-AS2]